MTSDIEKASTELQQIVADADTGGRKPAGIAAHVLFAVAVAWSLFQLWYASPLPFTFGVGILNDTEARSLHLAFALFLGFLAWPASRRAPRDRVWAFVIDPNQVGQCGPGVESIEVIDDRHFKASAKVGVGFISARFVVNLEFVDLDAPNAATIKAHGQAPGRRRTVISTRPASSASFFSFAGSKPSQRSACWSRSAWSSWAS